MSFIRLHNTLLFEFEGLNLTTTTTTTTKSCQISILVNFNV